IIPAKRNRTFLDYSDVEALRASGGSAPKRMDFNKNKNRPMVKADVSTPLLVLATSTTTPPKTTTLPPKSTTTHKPEGFFAPFGKIFEHPEHGLMYFIIFVIIVIFLLLLLLLCIWCCCCKKPVKGKYKVLEKENQPLNAEPDPEAGIAYSTEAYEKPLISKSMISRQSIKARKPKK
uniref:Uncharacterized protein n=1 Tax=Panagrolaimus sp. ES5 TaxID=591445 RepID=A0AC34GJD2_9BILA